MAKTIMISNDLYRELKIVKRDRSFSETIRDLMEKKNKKTIEGLKDCMGLLDKDDNEYDEIMKENRKMWERWTKRYA